MSHFIFYFPLIYKKKICLAVFGTVDLQYWIVFMKKKETKILGPRYSYPSVYTPGYLGPPPPSHGGRVPRVGPNVWPRPMWGGRWDRVTERVNTRVQTALLKIHRYCILFIFKNFRNLMRGLLLVRDFPTSAKDTY